MDTKKFVIPADVVDTIATKLGGIEASLSMIADTPMTDVTNPDELRAFSAIGCVHEAVKSLVNTVEQARFCTEEIAVDSAPDKAENAEENTRKDGE